MTADGLELLRSAFGKVLIGLLWAMTALIVGIDIVKNGSFLATLLIGGGLAGFSTVAWLQGPTSSLTRIVSSAALMGLVSLLVYDFAGSHFQIDMHMAFFAALAIVAVWCCWVSILAGAGVVAVHHLVLNFVLPYAVFPDGSDFVRVVIHAVILIVQTVALGWLANRLVHAFAVSQQAVDRAAAAGLEVAELARNDRAIAQSQTNRRSETDRAIAEFRARFDNGIGSVMTSLTAMQSSSTGLAGSSMETSKRADQAAGTSHEAARDVEAVAAAAEELSSSIGEINRQLSQTTQLVGAATEDARATNSEIAGLAEAAKKIGAVVMLIQDIAEQTNLLALNATIEAARAGESGRGFAVVAAEVKGLATQTARATQEISAQINAVQTSTVGAVEAIGRIANRMQEINQYTAAVANAVDQQGGATSEISRSVAGVANGTKQIVSVLSGVNSAAAETRNSARSVSDATKDVELATQQLRSDVDQFLARVAA